MSDDIVERLRESESLEYTDHVRLCDAAADEIERLRVLLDDALKMNALLQGDKAELRADNTRLRAALERIADTDPDDGTAWFHEAARAALNGGRDE